MFRIDGRAALVAGASGGIGAAIARTLHAQGAVVALSGTRRDALELLAAELGERAFVCLADLRDPAAAESLVEAAEGAAGPLAILVNNAGLTRDGLALRMGDADWQAVLDVDLTAPFRLARAGKFNEALALLKLNEEQFPKSSGVYVFRGNVLLLRADTNAAADAFREAIRRDTTNFEARQRLRAFGRQ